MFELENLFSGHKLGSDNPLCEGCSILEKQKPCHSHMDYKDIEESPVLFLSDSLFFSKTFRTLHAFKKQELDLIDEFYPEKYAVAASVKCPSVREDDMKTQDFHICRQHLEATINKIKPRLIFPCGNLAMKMLIKKSGITSKRGKSYSYETEEGHSAVVVPLMHPYSCIKEPQNKVLFGKDIRNAYEKFVLNKEVESDFKYSVATTYEDVVEMADTLKDTDLDLACDIETTGLDFRRDKIMTLSISSKENTYVIPCDHKDSPFNEESEDRDKVWDLIRSIMSNPKNRKIWHNAKFDIKFMLRYGVGIRNVWDTKIMSHVVDENLPNGLMDLVKIYFPNELEVM